MAGLGLTLTALTLGLLVACGAQPGDPPASTIPTSTVPVVRTDIVSRRQLNGTLTFSGSYSLINEAGPGVYTAFPAPGTIVTRGQTIYSVDDHPVTLLYGSPEWRSLSPGATDGSDVKQLEQNLLALGFANRSNLLANGHFDSFDSAAIRRWQAARGVARTGTVGLGDVVYEPGPIRISTVLASPGMPAEPGQAAIEATSTSPVVLVALDVAAEGSVKPGDAVTVALPDGSTALPGTVTGIGSVATPAASGAPSPNGAPAATVAVTITLGHTAIVSGFDLAPVSVDVVDTIHRGVLAVPVMALLAEPGGRYAVEVVSGAERRTITVATGLFDDRGLVEVSGPELHEGMLVEVPVS